MKFIYSNSVKTHPGLNLDISDKLVKVLREGIVILSLLVSIKRLYIRKSKMLENWQNLENLLNDAINDRQN